MSEREHISLPSILAVEEDEMSRSSIQGLIDSLGAVSPGNVYFVPTAEEARAMLTSTDFSPNVIIINVEGSNQGDFDLLKDLQERNQVQNPIQVVAISRDTHPETEEKCRILGVSAFITTPDLYPKLQNTIRYIFFGKEEE